MSYHHTTAWAKNSPTYFKIGLVISLSLSILIINYETSIKINPGRPFYEDIAHIFETQIFTHSESAPVPTKTFQKPVLIETAKIVTTDIAEERQMEVVKENIPIGSDENPNVLPVETGLTIVTSIKNEIPADANKIYTAVENMPYLSNCEYEQIESERRLCTQERLLSYIRQYLKYPVVAREAGIEGVVVVSFVINIQGEAQDFTIEREIGGGCGQEAVKVLSKVGTWNPGMQNGRRVNVKYHMPIKFSLQ